MPRLLDLFCGAGGAAMGYHRAGFEVVGVDIQPQPNYPFEFIQGDALEWDDRNFDAIHASPPCQAFSFASLHHRDTATKYPDLIVPIRSLLEATELPYVIENVMGSPLRRDLLLCGEMFGLRLHRHRVFEIGRWFVFAQPHGRHTRKAADNNCDLRPERTRMVVGHYADHDSASDAMGITWMTRDELREAIPPAYTEFIGEQLIEHIRCCHARRG